MTADDALVVRRLLPVSCLIVEGRSSTLTGRCAAKEPDIQPRSTRCFWLLNHLVRAQQERLRDRNAERVRGFQVDRQLELGGLLDR